MKIVIQSLNFSPDLTGIGKYTGEMADWFSSKGHFVQVVTAPSFYPAWRIKPLVKNYMWHIEERNNIRIWRCPIWVPSNPSGFKRILHVISFALSSFPIMLWLIFSRPEIIISIEPPLLTAPTAILASKISGAKFVLHIQDFEVDAAFDLGLIKGGTLRRCAYKLEKYILSSAHLVTTISSRMMEFVANKGVPLDRIFYLPNWADISLVDHTSSVESITRFTQNEAYRTRLNIPKDKIIALYSGNMGAKQGLDLLANVANKFKYVDKLIQKIHFIFCGEGVGREALVNACKDLTFVQFLDLQPLETLLDFLAIADIHLLPQHEMVNDLVMPSKLGGMMASGKPVVACARNNTEVSKLVNKFGIVVQPNNPEEFFDALLLLANDESLRLKFGIAGREYAVKNLDRNNLLNNFETQLRAIIA
jgi:colanic acid biosynthesis glycosyl transferase WcaI